MQCPLNRRPRALTTIVAWTSNLPSKAKTRVGATNTAQPTMSTLTTLPVELRQHILLAAVEEEQIVGHAWPQTLLSLLQTCRLLHDEMRWVLTSWSSSTWVLQKPQDLTGAPSLSLNEQTFRPPLHHLRISIFHETAIEVINTACWAMERLQYVRTGLVQTWIEAVPLLPQGIEEVLLDVTPAPGWMCAPHQKMQLDALLLEHRIARYFMNAHVDDFVNLVLKIRGHYAGKVVVKLTGTLSRRSKKFVDEVVSQCEDKFITVEWAGEYVSEEDGAAAQLQRIAHELAPEKKTPQMDAEDWQRASRLAFLRDVQWSEKSRRLVAPGEDDDLDDLKKKINTMAELVVNESHRYLTLPSTEPGYDDLIQNVAQDIGWKTTYEGEGDNRQILFYKEEYSEVMA
jgi:hypothetical protein